MIGRIKNRWLRGAVVVALMPVLALLYMGAGALTGLFSLGLDVSAAWKYRD